MPAYLIKSMVGIGPIRVVVFPEKKEAAAEWNKLAILEHERYIHDGLVAEVVYASAPRALGMLPEFRHLDQLPFRYANEDELALDSLDKCEELMGVRYYEPAGDFVAPASYQEPTLTDEEEREQMRAQRVALGEAWLDNPHGPAVLSYVGWYASIAWMFEGLRQGKERFHHELGVNRIYGRFKDPRDVMKQLRRGVLLPDIPDIASLQVMVEDRDAAREVIEAVSSNLTNNGQRVLPCEVRGDRVLTRVGDVPYEWRVIVEDRPRRRSWPQPLEELSTSGG